MRHAFRCRRLRPALIVGCVKFFLFDYTKYPAIRYQYYCPMKKFILRLFELARRRHSARVLNRQLQADNQRLESEYKRMRSERDRSDAIIFSIHSADPCADCARLESENQRLITGMNKSSAEYQRQKTEDANYFVELRDKCARLERMWEEVHIENVRLRRERDELRAGFAKPIEEARKVLIGCLYGGDSNYGLPYLVREAVRRLGLYHRILTDESTVRRCTCVVSPCKCDICDDKK